MLNTEYNEIERKLCYRNHGTVSAASTDRPTSNTTIRKIYFNAELCYMWIKLQAQLANFTFVHDTK